MTENMAATWKFCGPVVTMLICGIIGYACSKPIVTRLRSDWRWIGILLALDVVIGLVVFTLSHSRWLATQSSSGMNIGMVVGAWVLALREEKTKLAANGTEALDPPQDS
ncbi:MAG TPA: hypothetical protein VGK19_03865 [Capsulimonadaceae bacterium]|jgi:nucleoside permease NupC